MNTTISNIFSLSPHMRYALQASAAIVIAYMVPMAYGWSTQSYTAAIAVMTIASTTGLHLSVQKGALRVLGTVVGAAIGMILVANFAQERMLYLGILSLFVFVLLYLARAYRGDNTLFVLMLVTIMTLYNGSDKDIVTYAIDRTSMTLFGVIVYTLCSIYLLPQKAIRTKEEKKEIKRLTRFDFYTLEHLKAAFVGFLIYWVSVYFWIEFNPPLGFMVVTLATVLSATTIFSPVTPKMILIAFSMSLAFAVLSYVAILPNLHYGWQLALFLFLYAFIGYYFLPEALTMIFLIGTTTFYIQNTMFYNFGVFLNVLFALYLFMFILLFFYYIPFSSKSEDIVKSLLQRLHRQLAAITEPHPSFLGRLYRNYAKKALSATLASLHFWGEKLDTAFFDIDMEKFKEWHKKLITILKEERFEQEKITALQKVYKETGLENLFARSRF